MWRFSECMLEGRYLIYDEHHKEVCRVIRREHGQEIVKAHNEEYGRLAESG